MRLMDALNSVPLDVLKAIAQQHNIRHAVNVYRRDLVNLLATYLEDRTYINGALARLSAPARQALDNLIANDGHVIAEVFRKDYGEIPSYMDPYGSGGTRSPEHASSPVSQLWRFGLVYQAYGRLNNWEGEVYAVPDEILAILPKPHKAEFAELLASAPQPAATAPQPALVRDIGTLLCYLQRETVRAVRGDQLPRRDLVKLTEELSLPEDLSAVRQESDATWISFVHGMAKLMGLITVNAGMVTPSEQTRDWLKQDYQKQLWDTWKRFQRDGSWDDCRRALPQYTVNIAPGPQYTVAVRKGVLNALKRCPVSTWLTIGSLSQAIQTHDRLFMRSRPDDDEAAWPSWTRDYFRGGWEQVEGVLIHYLLCGPLNWFGIVQVSAFDAKLPPTLFRMTTQGAILLGMVKAPLIGGADRPITVQPTFEVIVTPETSPGVLYELQQIAELSKRDRASVYTLSQSALWHYLQGGGGVDDVIRFLERASQRDLPQNVAYSLLEWATRFGELRLEHATLLLANSEALLAEVRSNKKIGLRVKDVLSPRVVSLVDADLPSLIREMRRAGYWPKSGSGLASIEVNAPGSPDTVTVKTNDLVHLLASAVALRQMAADGGWHAPVSDQLVRHLTWLLPPAVLKQVQRLTQDAISRYQSAQGLEGGADDDDEP
jgi:hypothetical protein